MVELRGLLPEFGSRKLIAIPAVVGMEISLEEAKPTLLPTDSLVLPTRRYPISTAKRLRLWAAPARGKDQADLHLYAALHAQTNGEAVDAVTLLPQMLKPFITYD